MYGEWSLFFDRQGVAGSPGGKLLVQHFLRGDSAFTGLSTIAGKHGGRRVVNIDVNGKRDFLFYVLNFWKEGWAHFEKSLRADRCPPVAKMTGGETVYLYKFWVMVICHSQ